MNTKKGFTLVEMLVVIGLLAIFGVAIGIALNRNMKQNRVNQEKEFNQKVIGAANLYASNNSDILTSLYEDKGYIIVKVNDIIDAGYIQDNLVNPSTNEKIDGNENILISLDSNGIINIEYPVVDSSKDYLKVQTIIVPFGSSLDTICYEGINTDSLNYIKANGNPLNNYLIKNTNIKCDTSTVSPNKKGTYEVKYDYKTENGLWKQATRFVVVEEQSDHFSTLLPGENFRAKIKALSGQTGWINTNIKSIQRSSTLKSGLTDDNLVSTSDSKYPIYAWYTTNTINYYTEAEKIYMNSNSSGMFAHLN